METPVALFLDIFDNGKIRAEVLLLTPLRPSHPAMD